MSFAVHSSAPGIFIEARSKAPLLRRLLEALVEGRKRKAAEFTRAYVQAHPWLQEELANQRLTRPPASAA
jgi:hypothetical protein